MAAPKTLYICSNCQATYPKWQGKCGKCGEFGTVDEQTGTAASRGAVGVKGDMRPANVARPARRVADIDTRAHKHVSTGIGELDRVLGGGFVAGAVILLAAEPGYGKALALDTELATPEGWTTMGEVQVGDQLIGMDGQPTTVIATTEVMEDRPCYLVEFSDGSSVVADAEHQWYTQTRYDRLRSIPASVKTTRQIFDTLLVGGKEQRLNHSVPLAAPIAGRNSELPIPPYTLGAWLGDGTSASGQITCADAEILEEIRNEGFIVRSSDVAKYRHAILTEAASAVDMPDRDCKGCGTPFAPNSFGQAFCSPSCVAQSGVGAQDRARAQCSTCGAQLTGQRGFSGYCRTCLTDRSFRGMLRKAGVLSNKHIPEQYLRASETDRRALLAGLMDTDGYAMHQAPSSEIGLTSKRLADGVYELATSLGYKVNRREKVVAGRTPESSIQFTSQFTGSPKPFRLSRKRARLNDTHRPTQSVRYISKVTLIESVPVRCVQVDNADHTYLITRSFIPTHNSTLLLEVANKYAESGKTALYISGEESAEQITLRARRIGADADTLLIADETDLSVILGHIEETSPDLIVIDSVQTIASPDLDGRAGGVSQVHEVSAVLARTAKALHIPMVLVAQITKDGNIAGPRALTHLVDVVLFGEGDRTTSLRLLRSEKNRWGAADEIAAFEQTDTGMSEVPDPSGLFLTGRDEPVPGTCITVTMEGRRPLIAEVQALVAPTNAPNPRRGVSGLDTARMAMLVAVTERHGRVRMFDKDTFLATVAGMKIVEPAADLAVCLALASASWDAPMPSDVAAIGEVALSGDIRAVNNMTQRLNEAARLGFKRIMVPAGTKKPAGSSLVLIEVPHVNRAFAALKQMAPAAPAKDQD